MVLWDIEVMIFHFGHYLSASDMNTLQVGKDTLLLAKEQADYLLDMRSQFTAARANSLHNPDMLREAREIYNNYGYTLQSEPIIMAAMLDALISNPFNT